VVDAQDIQRGGPIRDQGVLGSNQGGLAGANGCLNPILDRILVH
jgi:hypothetical protein